MILDTFSKKQDFGICFVEPLRQKINEKMNQESWTNQFWKQNLEEVQIAALPF